MWIHREFATTEVELQQRKCSQNCWPVQSYMICQSSADPQQISNFLVPKVQVHWHKGCWHVSEVQKGSLLGNKILWQVAIKAQKVTVHCNISCWQEHRKCSRWAAVQQYLPSVNQSAKCEAALQQNKWTRTSWSPRGELLCNRSLLQLSTQLQKVERHCKNAGVQGPVQVSRGEMPAFLCQGPWVPVYIAWHR